MTGAGKPVLYLGDDGLEGAAAYLAGVMSHHRIGYRHLGSGRRAEDRLLRGEYRLVVLSDYPAANLAAAQADLLAERVRAGTGLLMIGGWDSFQGLGGGYRGTRVGELLPVELSSGDDRVNWPFPCLVWKEGQHPITDGLPLAAPPGIGGYNRFTVRAGCERLLSAVRFRPSLKEGACSFVEEGRDPLLVVGQHGRGRVAAFASDVAPHWVGGFVDWGERRVRAGEPGREVEVGEHYARFFANLLVWTGRL